MKASGIFLCLYLFSYQTWAHKGKRLCTTLEGSIQDYHAQVAFTPHAVNGSIKPRKPSCIISNVICS